MKLKNWVCLKHSPRWPIAKADVDKKYEPSSCKGFLQPAGYLASFNTFGEAAAYLEGRFDKTKEITNADCANKLANLLANHWARGNTNISFVLDIFDILREAEPNLNFETFLRTATKGIHGKG